MAIAEVGSGSQRATVQGVNVASAAVAFPANVGNGSLLTVQLGGFSTTTVAVSDTLGTSYATLGRASTTLNSAFISYGIAPSAGACTVTIDPDGVYFSAVIDEFSGVNATPLDVDGGGSTGTSTTPADSVTTLTDDDLVLATAVVGSSGTASWAAGSGKTLQDSHNSNLDTVAYAAEFQIVGAAGSQTMDFTIASSIDWGVYTAAFKPAAAPTGGIPTLIGPRFSLAGRRGLAG